MRGIMALLKFMTVTDNVPAPIDNWQDINEAKQ